MLLALISHTGPEPANNAALRHANGSTGGLNNSPQGKGEFSRLTASGPCVNTATSDSVAS